MPGLAGFHDGGVFQRLVSIGFRQKKTGNQDSTGKEVYCVQAGVACNLLSPGLTQYHTQTDSPHNYKMIIDFCRKWFVNVRA